MEKVRLEIEFVTPCFLGGADATAAPEWNGKAIRGQLRWWFRAVAGGYFASRVDQDNLLKVVSEQEEGLFGTTRSSSSLMVRAGASPEHLQEANHLGSRLTAEEIATEWGANNDAAVADRLRIRRWNKYEQRKKEVSTNPVQYLAFGPYSKGELHRPYFLPAKEAKLDFWFRRSSPVSEEQCKLFQLTLWAWLNLGGVGSRSRKGFGSLRGCTGSNSTPPWLPADLNPKNRQEFESSARALLDLVRGAPTDPPQPVPTWSRFSPGAKIFIAERPCLSWSQALQRLGCWLIGFRRRYGHDSKEERVSRRSRDYSWVYGPLADGAVAAVPDRAGFGAPLGFSDRNPNNPTRFVEPTEEGSRRASPLLLHVAKLGENLYYPVLTHLPALLVPTGGELRIDLGRATPSSPPTSSQKKIVSEFLNDLVEKKLIQPIETEESA